MRGLIKADIKKVSFLSPLLNSSTTTASKNLNRKL